MKAAIVVPAFLTGGAEHMAAQLAVQLKKQGADVEVISMYPRQGHIFEEKILAAGVPLHFMDKSGSASIGAMVRLWKTLSDLKPDVVHGHIYASFYALPWVMTHRAKLVHTIHTEPGKEFPGPLQKLLQFCAKLGKLRFVTISKANQEIACRVYGGTGEQYPYINNPVETQRFYAGERENGTAVTFVNVCRLNELKNISLAIRAMAQVVKELPDAKLVLVGDGELRQELEAETAALGLEGNVIFAGEQPNPEDYLARADVFVLSSLVEGLPLCVLEAMAAGLPVIATEVGGLPDLIGDNGALVPSEDVQALAAQMLRFARDPALRERCGKASLEAVEPFRAETCAREYARLYARVWGKSE